MNKIPNPSNTSTVDINRIHYQTVNKTCMENDLKQNRNENAYQRSFNTGATNVGSVDVYIDKELKTNQWSGLKWGKSNQTNDFNEIKLPSETKLTKGELLGQFNMGSTVVLIFEAPKKFK